MKYYVLEIQKHPDGGYAYLMDDTAANYREAESKAYGKLQYAALSNLPVHTVTIIDEEGTAYNPKCYRNEEGSA